LASLEASVACSDCLAFVRLVCACSIDCWSLSLVAAWLCLAFATALRALLIDCCPLRAAAAWLFCAVVIE